MEPKAVSKWGSGKSDTAAEFGFDESRIKYDWGLYVLTKRRLNSVRGRASEGVETLY